MAHDVLGAVAEIVMGQSPPGETCNEAGHGLPLLNGPTEFGSHHPTPVQFTTNPRKLARLGDILFCVRGSTTGRMNWADREYAIGRGLAAIRHNRGQDFQHFLRGLIDFKLPELLVQATGSTFPNISFDQLVKLPCELPNENDQRVIASVLGALDDKVELNRRMNETLEALTHACFKSCFVDATQAGLPKKWHEGMLGEVAENPRCGIQANKIRSDTPYIGLEHMPRRCIALSDWGYADELESNKFKFQRGEILFGKLRPYFHKVGVAPLGGVCSTDILVIRPKEPEWFGFVLGHVSSVELVNHTDAASTGTKMPRTNWNDVSRFEVALPPESLAAEFSKQIRPMIDRIIANIHESKTLTALREALLPKLLSGQLRVPQAERSVSKIIPLYSQQPVKPTKKTTDEFVEAVTIAHLTRQLFDPMFATWSQALQ